MTVDRARLRGPEGTPLESRSWWLRETLGADPGAPCPPLEESLRTDVAIVGGGYTGLWTAFHLKKADPGADIRNLRLATTVYRAGLLIDQ